MSLPFYARKGEKDLIPFYIFFPCISTYSQSDYVIFGILEVFQSKYINSGLITSKKLLNA